MKCILHSYRSRELTVADVPPPNLRPGGVLVHNAVSLISPGTERQMLETARKSLASKAWERPDLVRQVLDKARREGIGPGVRAVMSRLDTPVPLGYSSTGVVIEVGEGVDEFQTGDPVACAGAGYAVHAEVIFVPCNLVVKLPPSASAHVSPPPPGLAEGLGVRAVTFEDAAFTTVGAIALQGVRIANVRIGEVVAVIGLGLIGLLTVQLLKAAGCRVLGMDLNLARCQLAESLGCDATTTGNSQFAIRSSQFTEGHGVDAVIITAATKSNQPIELAAELCREKGRVVVVGAVGMDVPRRPFYEKELELHLSRSYGPGRYDPLYEEKGIDYPYGYVRWTERRNMAAFLDLVAQGKVQVQPLISHRFPIDRALEAYELIAGKTDEPFLGVLITYPDQPDLSRKIVLNKTVQASRFTHHVSRSNVEPSTFQSVTIGMIGAGAFAKSVLLPKLKAISSVELATVCTATGLSTRHTAEKLGFTACTTDAGAIFDDLAINAVFIATRHNLHAPLVIKALQAGKHVFVEKPLCLNERELAEIVQIYDDLTADGKQQTAEAVTAVGNRRSAVVMVGYNRRFAPLTQKVRQIFQSRAGSLAIHYRVNAGYVPPDHWVHDPDEGGGRIIGEVCHFVDWIKYLVGAPPVRVYAQALPGDGRYPTEDNVLITLTFADGSAGTIHYLANGDPRVPKERIEVFGDGAVVVIEDFRTGWLMRHGRRTRLGRRFRPRQDKGHAAELQAFVTAVREGDVSPIPFEDAVLATLTTFRIRESLRTGLPVDVQPGESREEPSS